MLMPLNLTKMVNGLFQFEKMIEDDLALTSLRSSGDEGRASSPDDGGESSPDEGHYEAIPNVKSIIKRLSSSNEMVRFTHCFLEAFSRSEIVIT
jgi:hypothetical protein